MCPVHETDCDYYNRVVVTGEIDVQLADEINAACEKLIVLLNQDDRWSGLDSNASIKAIQTKIRDLNKRADTQKTKNVVALLNYLVQIKSLGRTLNVPGEGDYITCGRALSGVSKKGVTKKIGLISKDRVQTELSKLDGIGTLNFDTDDIQSINFNLKEQAMLKLPKHGKSRGVQREAMALAMSRILGFRDIETTKSTTVAYQGGSALFVPFDDIRELNQFATGKDMWREFSFSTRPNTHYATINPLGNPRGKGLRANPYIEDFGSGLGLTYLCSDTDALGGNSQNKALLRNKLYIFDQAFQLDDRLELDSRFSMKPKTTSYSKAYLRHGRGRNRTLIEDSSIERKFDSLMQLVHKTNELLNYCLLVANGHRKEKTRLILEHQATGHYFYSFDTRAKIKRLKGLRNDALQIRLKVEQRIRKINAMLPKVAAYPAVNQKQESELQKKALVLEKLLNKPVLFTPEGRPYRNPWTNVHAIKALSVDYSGGDYVTVTFNNKIPEDVFEMLKRHSQGHFITMEDFKITMPNAAFLALKESQLFPEHNDELNPNEKYLNLDDLNVIKSGYSKEPSIEKIINLIEQYHRLMNVNASTKEDKIAAIQHTMKHLEQWTNKSSDKGFGQHVLKKFHFDVQQRLRQIIQPRCDMFYTSKLNAAFRAAMKLDQVEKFNQVVVSFVSSGEDLDKLNVFLTACIQYDHEACLYSYDGQATTDEMSSIDAAKTYPVEALSKKLSEEAEATISALNSEKARKAKDSVRELRAHANSRDADSVEAGADNGRNDGLET